MKKIRMRMLKGALIIIGSMTCAILGSFLRQWLISICPNQEAYITGVMGTGGVVIGLAAIIFSVFVWTDNLGDGFKDDKN